MADQKSATRPLPSLLEMDTSQYWLATKNHELTYQQCGHCDRVVFYPRAHCPGCNDGKLEIKVSTGEGTIYTYSIIRQSYHPFFRNLVPYAVAWIDLNEGPRILANITGVEDPVNEIFVGQKVAVVWEDHEDLSIPLFKPL
tara:strand:- start:586 stop:1008 length:423 start_codon:yes stop_codon:yes gene_type:complete